MISRRNSLNSHGKYLPRVGPFFPSCIRHIRFLGLSPMILPIPTQNMLYILEIQWIHDVLWSRFEQQCWFQAFSASRNTNPDVVWGTTFLWSVEYVYTYMYIYTHTIVTYAPHVGVHFVYVRIIYIYICPCVSSAYNNMYNHYMYIHDI